MTQLSYLKECLKEAFLQTASPDHRQVLAIANLKQEIPAEEPRYFAVQRTYPGVLRGH